MKLRNTWALSPGRKSAVVVAAAALFSMGLAGCGGDDTTARTGPGFEQVNSPKGVVTGAVVDTNGNPVAGATVTVAGLPSVTTSASGQYRILNVEVTAAATQGPGAAANTPIPVTIQGPAGFGGVSLQIAPQAQITSSETPAGGGTGQANPQQVFIDGFIAGAGTVAIPQFNTTLRGVLRNGQTGQPIANQVVTADFRTLAPDQANPTGVVITGYSASGQITAATTAADGSFSYTGLAGDATYDLFAAGFAGAQAGNGGAILAGVATNAESNNTVVLGNVVAFPVSTTDLIRPFLTGVSNAVDNATPTLLATSSNGLAPSGGFVLNFSEPLAGPFNTSTVRVQVRGPNQATAVELAPAAYTVTAAGNSVTVNTTAAVAPGSFVNIIVLRESLVDTAAAANTYNTAPGATAVNGAQNGGAVNLPDQLADQGVPAGITPANAAGLVFFQLQTFQPGNAAAAQPGVVGTGLGQRTVNQGTTGAKPSVLDTTKALTDTVGDVNGINAPGATAPLNSTVNTAGTVINYGWNGSIEQLNGNGNSIRLALQRLNLALQGAAVDQNNARGAVIDPLQTSGARSGGKNLSATTAALQADTQFVHQNTAVVRFTVPANARSIVIGLQRNGVPTDVGFFPVGTGASAPQIIGRYDGNATFQPKAVGNGQLRYVIDPKDNTEITVVIAGGAHNVGGVLTGGLFASVPQAGDVVVLDSLTAAGTSVTDASSTIALADVVAPTTEVQLTMDAIGAAAGVQFAGGGAVVQGGNSQVIGTPILPVTPQLLDIEESAAQITENGGLLGYVTDDLNQPTELGGRSISGLAAGAQTPATNYANAVLAKVVVLPQIVPPNAADTNGVAPGTTLTAHNATGSLAYIATGARQLGVAFTEPVVLARPAADVITALNAQLPTARITAIAPQVTKDEVGNDVHLLLLTVDDIFKFENDSRVAGGTVLDFGGQIMDAAGNIAVTDAAGVTPRVGVNPRVVIRDFLPPVMLRGFYDGTNFVFDFHEAVKKTGALTLKGSNTCTDVALNLAPASVTLAANLAGTANARVIVPASALAGVNPNDCFDGPAYAEAAYSAANLGTATVLPAGAVTPTPTHFGVDYSAIQDRSTLGLNNNTADGNTWQQWEANVPGVAGLGIQRPVFIGANVVGPFDIVTSTVAAMNFNPLSCTGNAQGSLSVNCEFRVTHPIRVAQVGALPATDFDGDSAVVVGGVITNQALINYFNLKFAVLGNDNATVRGNVTGVSLFDGNGNILNAGNATLTPAQANSASRITLAFTTAAIQAVANNPAMSDRVWLRNGKTLTSALVGTAAAVNDGGVEFNNGVRVLTGLIRRDDNDQSANPIPANNGVVGGELLPNIATNP